MKKSILLSLNLNKVKSLLLLVASFVNLLLVKPTFSQTCTNLVNNGTFTGSLNGWSYQTQSTGWYYDGSSNPNQASTDAQGTTLVSLKQTITGLNCGNITLVFDVKGTNANNVSTCNTTANLFVKLGGTTYLTIVNGPNNSQITTSNITASGGASFTSSGFPITVAGTRTYGTITLTIPWTGACSADLEFVADASVGTATCSASTASGGDDWNLDNVSLSSAFGSNPTLSSSSLSIPCGLATANLTTITASGSTCSNNTFEWHTVANPTSSITKVTTPSSVAAGTYYYVAKNNCTVCYGTGVPLIVSDNCDTDGDGISNSIDVDDDNDGIPDSVECGFCSGGTGTFQNGGFELPEVQTGTAPQLNQNLVPGWRTTANDGLIEISNNALGATAAEGKNFVEINATQTATLYQTFCLNGLPGTITFSLKHRGRLGTDVATVSFGTSLSTLTPAITMSDDNTAWGSYSGTYSIAAGQTEVVVAFVAVSTATGDNSVGNFLDDIKVSISQGCLDSDGDGIINSLDLDSDNDGCSDAYEAGATTNTTSNFKFSGPYGTNGLDDSKETAVDNGVLNYTPTYADAVIMSVAKCITPGVGVIDCSKTQILTAPVVGQAGQKTLLVTVNVSTAGCFSPFSISGSGITFANNINKVCTLTTGVQQLSIPINYDGSALGTANFTVGQAGSCSADLTTTPKKAINDVWTLDCVPTSGPSLK